MDSILVGAQKIKNCYDAFGRLVKRDVSDTISYYWWDGDNLFAELDATGQKRAEYSYYPGLDNLHALVDQDDKVYFAHSDGMGNVVGLVSDTKVLSRTYDYDLKGRLVGLGDIKPFNDRDRARFKGALWMGPEVDLYYMRNSWYETSTGRFLSEDLIGLDGGINVYVFAGDNPVSGRDPSGLTPCDPPVIAHQLDDQGNCELVIIELDVVSLDPVVVTGRRGGSGGFPYAGVPFGRNPISSPFGPRIRGGRPGDHFGIDIPAPMGTPTRVVCGGTVYFAGPGQAKEGIKVNIRRGGYSQFYIHLDRLADGIEIGSVVSRGQVIGFSGESGNATAPTLHFGASGTSGFIDPLAGVQFCGR